MVRCNSDNVTCSIPQTICVSGTRCQQPVCYPMPLANIQICPPSARPTSTTTTSRILLQQERQQRLLQQERQQRLLQQERQQRLLQQDRQQRLLQQERQQRLLQQPLLQYERQQRLLQQLLQQFLQQLVRINHTVFLLKLEISVSKTRYASVQMSYIPVGL
ncbi:unnamed protein product [Rotaria sp. Silwood2]|nr:unnamed protein product [Rotaria sp. Silwood2]